MSSSDSSSKTEEAAPVAVVTPSHAGAYLIPSLTFPGLRKVHEYPPIYEVENFLSREECDQLIEAGRPHLSRSVVVGGKDGSSAPRVSAPTRTSSSYFFPKHKLEWLNERVRGFTFANGPHPAPPNV